MRTNKCSASKRISIAKDLWSWVPHPSQREWLLDEHRVKVAACGRRWGKTESAAVDIATYAITNPGSVQMIVAPTYDQSKLISGTVERLLLRNPDIRQFVQVVKTPYPDIRYMGSRIMARTADDDGRNLRGHSADRVIVDEAAFVRDEVIEEVIGPMLADRNGQLVMISTPFGKNHFYRAFVQGQSSRRSTEMNADGEAVGRDMGSDSSGTSLSPIGDHPRSSAARIRSFRFPSWANPHISAEYVEHQRTVLTDRQFRVEYEAEFVDDTNAVFPWADIQGAVECGVRSDECGVAEPGGIRIAGIDWARYSDYTAVVVLEVSGLEAPPPRVAPSPCHQGEQPPYRVLQIDRFNRMDWSSQVERVCDLLAKYGVTAVVADQTSVGDPVLEILRNALWTGRGMDIAVEGVVFTNQNKREMVDNLAIRLAHREIGIPADENLVRELQYYEYELTEHGNVRTAARRGYHDDCVMALALALHLAPRYGCYGGFASSGRKLLSVKGW
jgi:hypothetical protein